MLEHLGTKLKTARINMNFSRKQISDLVGVSVSAIGLYESGERLPSLLTLIKLATQYKVSVDYLIDCENIPKNTLSLEGLNEQQVQALKLTAECFHHLNKTL